MRVVYVSTLRAGGPVAHLLDLAPSVAEAGLDVLVVCGSSEVADAFRSRGVEAHARPLRHKLDLAGATQLWPELRGADVVHTHDRRAGLLARPAARARGAAAVHTLHGVPEELCVQVGRVAAPPSPGVSRARLAYVTYGTLGAEALLARLGTVVVPSQALADYLVRHHFPRRGLRVIPNGIVPPAPRPGREARRPLVVGTAANLEHHKGIDLLLDACARLTTPVRLEIYGDGSQRAALEARSRALRLDASFHGHVPDARDRLADLDVFVLASRGENLPVVLLEAMAAGTPVVATRVGGVPELVVDGVSGVLVEPESVEALAAGLEQLLGDGEQRAALAAAGAERVRERFDARVLAGELARLYAELVEA